MLLDYNSNSVWQSVKDTWLPILIHVAILCFIIITVLKRNKD